jgi:endonuclease YncB( thermonuclease family)
MTRTLRLVALTWLGFAAMAATAGGPGPNSADKSEPVRERVRGEWRLPGDMVWRITGRVKVLDAHTLQYEDGTTMNISGGMDAPDLGQRGVIDGKLYPCGKEAAAFLEKLIGGRPVTCYTDFDRPIDPKKPRGGDAFVGETSLGAEMVRSGWAMAHHTGTTPYEVMARDHKRGLWRGEFVFPEKWRKGERLPQEK